MVGNVTVEPLEMARAATELEIKEVVSVLTGKDFDARKLIESHRYDRLIKARSAIRESMRRGKPRVSCFICGTPVYLVGRHDKSFFFRHAVEDGSCPAKTKDKLSYDQIRALKYQGASESEAHRRTKTLIMRSLQADERFSCVGTELTWASLSQNRKRRRPDVSAVYSNGTKIAFEAQLSTTFLDVVVGRRIFYKDEGGLLIWILPRFDPDYRRMTDDDLLFNNNSNVLVVDRETEALSETTGKFMLRCHYRMPSANGSQRSETWQSCLVDFGDLTLDLEKQRAFWFDFDVAETAVQEKLKVIADARYKERHKERADRLRSEVYAFWSCYGETGFDSTQADNEWGNLRDSLAAFGAIVPVDCRRDSEFRTAISAIMSVVEKEPVGFRFKKLIQVAHHIADQHKSLLRLFGWALKVYGAEELISLQDGSQSWARKLKGIRLAMRANDPEYQPSHRWDEALKFLFPEMAEKISPSTR